MSGYLQMSDGRIAPVRDGLVLGRVAACDVLVDDPKASRRHARIVVEAGVVEIEDLQSSNGTLLNGHPVSRRVLRDGDTIRIGKTELVFREGAVPGGATTAAAPAAAIRPATDDVDLFGETTLNAPAPTPVPPPAKLPPSRPAAPPPPVPIVSPAPAAASVPPAPSRPAAPTPPAPVVRPAPSAPPAPLAPRVVEFADEVVEVRQPAKTEATRPAAGSAEPIVKSQRILQYSKQGGGGGGLLGDDMSQLSAGTRSLVYAGVLVVAAGIVVGIIWLMG